MTFPFKEVEQLRTGYFVSQMQGKNFSPTYEFVKGRPKKWAKLDAISPWFFQQVVVTEDLHFFEHHGVDWMRMKDQFIYFFKKKANTRGAGTITQQLVQNVFFLKQEGFLERFYEIPLALYIDWRIPKKKILEAYLNSVSFGERVYGISDASRIYFSKAPALLTPREGTFLITFLPQLKMTFQTLSREDGERYIGKAHVQIMKRMVASKYISETQYESQIGQKYVWENSDDLDLNVSELDKQVSN